MSTELLASFYLAKPAFAEETVAVLARLLRENFPSGHESLKLGLDEDDRAPIPLNSSRPLLSVIQSKAIVRNGIGDVLVWSDEGFSLSLVSSKLTLPFESNRYSIEMEDKSTEGVPAAEWLKRWFLSASRALPLRYGCAYQRAERWSKNLISDETGTRAVGVDFDSALPGLYWLNFFGPEYVALLGEDKLASAPAFEVQAAGSGFMVQVEPEPSEWESQATQQREARILAHLGRQYFFSREDAARDTVAPDFWAECLRERRLRRRLQ